MKMSDKHGISAELCSIIENTNDLVFAKDRNSVYIACSKSYALECVRCNGVEDVIGKTDLELFEDKSIAEKYRADDRELFASGKPMAKFQEKILDKDGKRHMGLTTKFLLYDKHGNPVALFGQYHDIGEQVENEIERRIDVERKITAAVNSIFYASYFINLEDYSFKILKGTDYAKTLLRDCKTIQEACELFIKHLVMPEDQEKMREFCNADTITERLGTNSHIDCEYRGTFVEGWCQTSLLPVFYDKNGNVTHVLFVISKVDHNRAKNLEESASSKKDLDALFDVAPSGIAVYKWDGEKLRFVNANQHYRDLFEYGDLKEGEAAAYTPLHPDDLEDYQKAISIALTETHHLEYVFRLWNKKEKRYKWIQNNAIAKPKADGTLLVYAIFTDVTEQKEAELKAEKNRISLETALNASNQLCCEYDPKLHTIQCLTEDNIFHAKTQMSNYPECLRDMVLVHPEDIEILINTVHRTDDGIHSAHCDVRALYDGQYRWYSCRFEPYHDTEKERPVVIISIVDATLRISSIQSYKQRLHKFEKSNENAIYMAEVNLTKNSFSNVQAEGIIERYSESADSLDAFLMLSSKAVFDPQEQQAYCNVFRCKEMLRRFENGETQIRFEHFFQLNENHTMMAATIFKLVKEPITGDVVGIVYVKDLNKENVSRILLNAALVKDYPMAALVYASTGEYYLYEVNRGEYCTHKQNFWSAVSGRLYGVVNEQELGHIRSNLTGEKIIAFLGKQNEYVYAFYGQYHGKRCRLEAMFRYADQKHHLILAILRNITDEQLYQQYKYDSEHDALTKLYKRNKVFAKARELLNAHPDKQFVMLHCDIRHFHLYNTFFGEAEGDRLLCEIADLMRKMGCDYDYWAYGRIESDVFCAFFPIVSKQFEKQIRSFLRELKNSRNDFPLTPAIGAYWVTDKQMSIEEMFSYATIAAKSRKINLYGLISRYDEEMDQDLKDTQQITSEMHTAIEQEQFKVYLQPKYSLRSEKMIGAEALVRWKHPTRGMISPGKFIPTFEKNGFIADLDRYMWEHVCKILRRWQDEGKPMYPVSVNISRVNMYSQETVPFLKALIEKYEIDPKYLELELTETAYMDDPEELKRMLKELQEYGFKILMDDFGSGYSSLNTLRNLPVDVLKLDMKFLSTTQDDERGLVVLSSVIRISKLLNLPVVAEGVETQEQTDYLRSIGCEYVQGFFFAKPMSIADYEALLVDGESDKAEQLVENTQTAIPASTEISTEDSLVSIGVLQYYKEKFAYLRTNKKFLSEFDLIENLAPASKVFRAHLDDVNYGILLQAFADCSETKENIMFCINWKADDGTERKYHGYVHYRGNIGTYADLLVMFVNVTGMRNFLLTPNR